MEKLHVSKNESVPGVKDAKVMMPRKLNHAAVASSRLKKMKTEAYNRPIGIQVPKLKEKEWRGCDNRMDFLKALVLLIIVALTAGLFLWVIYALMMSNTSAAISAGSVLLRFPGAVLIWPMIIGLLFGALFFIVGLTPFVRSQVRRVHDFGWSGYNSVILPAVINFLVSLSCCIWVSIESAFHYFTSVSSFVSFIWFVFGVYPALAAAVIGWLLYRNIVFPYWKAHCEDEEEVVNRIEKEKIHIWFVVAFIGILSVICQMLMPSVARGFDFALMSISMLVGVLLGCWSLLLLLICLFRKGKENEYDEDAPCENGTFDATTQVPCKKHADAAGFDGATHTDSSDVREDYMKVLSNLNKLMLMVLNGYNVNKCDATGQTLMVMAVFANRTEALQILLLAPNRDVNVVNKFGETPLGAAAYWGRTECVRILLSAPGIDINKVDSNGKTPLWIAVKKGHTECAELLRKAGAMEGDGGGLYKDII